MMQDYLQFNVAHKDLLERAESGQINDEYLWFAAHNLLVAETIYRLNKNDKSWRAAAIHIAKNQKPYLLYEKFPCEEYDQSFIKALQKDVDNAICPQK